MRKLIPLTLLLPWLAFSQTTPNSSMIRFQALYGPGTDGDIAPTADTTLTRDMYANNLTLGAGIDLYPDGHRIFVARTLTLAATATVTDTGKDGAAGGGGGGAVHHECRDEPRLQEVIGRAVYLISFGLIFILFAGFVAYLVIATIKAIKQARSGGFPE